MALKQTRLACFLAVMWALACTSTAETTTTAPPPVAPTTTGSDDVAKVMITRLDTLVLPLIKEGHLNDTTLVTSRLTRLATKAEVTNSKKTAIDAPDTALDDCLLLENSTLHGWKLCNSSRANQKEVARANCESMRNAGVGHYTIEKDMYKQGGARTPPQATCNFETFTLEGSDNAGCEFFVDDITNEAKGEYESDYSTYTAAAQECQTSQEQHSKTILDCSQKAKAHRAQEEACVLKDTTVQVKLCAFQSTLQAKCTTLSQVHTAIEDLAVQEESRNKELRTVSLSKCLFDRYSNHDEKCFKTTVLDGCEVMVNGASEEYATAAAEKIHGFRQAAASHTQPGNFPCTAETITIGTNGLSYAKTDADDEFSYYVKQGPRTYSVSEKGVLSPSVCG